MITVYKDCVRLSGQTDDIILDLAVILCALKEKLGTKESLDMIKSVLEVVFKDEIKIKVVNTNAKEITTKKENTGKKDIEEIKEILDKLPDDLSKMLKHLL